MVLSGIWLMFSVHRQAASALAAAGAFSVVFAPNERPSTVRMQRQKLCPLRAALESDRRDAIASRDGTRADPRSKSMDDIALWRSPGGHCAGAIVLRELVGAPLSQSRFGPWRLYVELLPALDSRPRARRAHRDRVCELHRPDRGSVRGFRRHSHHGARRGDPAGELRVPADWRDHRQCAGHHRRLDAPDPPLAADERVSHHGPPRGFLHSDRLERRRLPDPHRRSAALPRLSRRHPVLVGGTALLANLGGRSRGPAAHVLCCGSTQLRPRASGRPPGDRRTA